MKVCGQCSHYIGAGDWDICCNSVGGKRLCYEDTDAGDCPHFEQTRFCRNVTSYVGMFRCSICDLFVREEAVGDECPRCGRSIHGALWNGQRHYKEDTNERDA